MAVIVSWTTADLDFILRNEDGTIPTGIFDGMTEAIITLAQGGASRVEKSLSEGEISVSVEDTTLSLRLDQSETARLRGGEPGKPRTAQTQVNIYYGAGRTRVATFEGTVDVYRNLHPRRVS